MLNKDRITSVRQLLSEAAHAAPGQTTPLPAVESIRSALDELDEIQSALEGMRDLLNPVNPKDDLHCVDRGNVATLLTLLLRQQQQVRERAWNALLSIRVEGSTP